MEKEQILSTVKGRVGETSLSDRTMMAYIESHLPADGTEPDENYFAKAEAFLKSLGGQYNHDVASQVTEFKKNYKSDGVNVVKADGNEALAQLKSEFEKLREEMAKAKRVSTADRLRADVLKKSEELKVRNQHLWEDAVELVTIADDADFDKVFASAKDIYESKLKRYYGEGAKPYGTTDTGKAEADNNKKLREAYLKKLRDEGKI